MKRALNLTRITAFGTVSSQLLGAKIRYKCITIRTCNRTVYVIVQLNGNVVFKFQFA